MKNPCPECTVPLFPIVYGDNAVEVCNQCDKRHKYENHLEKKRKYKRGGKIESLDDLYKQEFVYIFSKVTHRGWFGAMQLHFLANMIKSGRLSYAIKKEDTDNA